MHYFIRLTAMYGAKEIEFIGSGATQDEAELKALRMTEGKLFSIHYTDWKMSTAHTGEAKAVRLALVPISPDLSKEDTKIEI